MSSRVLLLAVVPVLLQAQSAESRAARKEAALGAALAVQITRDIHPRQLPELNSYLEDLGRQLVAGLPGAAEQWEFRVMTDYEPVSTYEPLSLPGGWIFVSTKLVLAAENEAEFAGMLAHAMAHVALRQGIRQSPGDVNYLAAIPVVTLYGGAAFGDSPKPALLPAGYLNTHREQELTADRVAVAAMASAGFDPNALLSYVSRMQSRVAATESTLPGLVVRLTNLRNAITGASLPTRHRSGDLFLTVRDEFRHELR